MPSRAAACSGWSQRSLLGDGALQANTLVQIRTFAALFLAPEAAAWCVLLAFAARASIENGALVLTRGARRLELALRDIVAVEPWRVPIPGPGASLRLASGERWRYGLAHADPAGLGAGRWPRPVAPGAGEHALARDDAMRKPAWPSGAGAWTSRLRSSSCSRSRSRFRRSACTSTSRTAAPSASTTRFGLTAYLTSFALWWAAWAIGVVLCAAALRAVIEAGTLVAVLLRPGQAIAVRRWLERLGLAALYLGLPAWLLLRVFASAA